MRLPDGALRAAMTKMEFMAARIALILQIANELVRRAQRNIFYPNVMCNTTWQNGSGGKLLEFIKELEF